MHLYTLYYYHANGAKMAECDFNRPAPERAQKGEVIHCWHSSWDGSSYWLDDQGRCWDGPPWERTASLVPN